MAISKDVFDMIKPICKLCSEPIEWGSAYYCSVRLNESVSEWRHEECYTFDRRVVPFGDILTEEIIYFDPINFQDK